MLQILRKICSNVLAKVPPLASSLQGRANSLLGHFAATDNKSSQQQNFLQMLSRLQAFCHQLLLVEHNYIHQATWEVIMHTPPQQDIKMRVIWQRSCGPPWDKKCCANNILAFSRRTPWDKTCHANHQI